MTTKRILMSPRGPKPYSIWASFLAFLELSGAHSD